jgi:hypothetical protein
MTEWEPDPPTAEQSAFSSVFHPFHVEQVNRAIDTSLPSSIYPDTTHDPPSPSSPLEADPQVTDRRDRIYREALLEHKSEAIVEQDVPVRPRAKHNARAKSRRSAVTTMRRTQIETMLLRCQLLQATILSLECRQESNKTTASIQTHYETMRQLAHQALLMVQGLRNPDLSANCEYWAGRMSAGFDDQDQYVDTSDLSSLSEGRCGYADFKGQALHQTTKEQQIVNVPLQPMIERSEGRRSSKETTLPYQSDDVKSWYCKTSQPDSLHFERLLTMKDELDAAFEYLNIEDGYGNLLGYLEDETIDPQDLLLHKICI